MSTTDKMERTIAKVVTSSSEPLETKEIQEKVTEVLGKDVTRSKLLYRLNDLRGQGEIFGKSIGSGKGVWIWWKRGQEDD
jgi:repressor of nif and glnA expression